MGQYEKKKNTKERREIATTVCVCVCVCRTRVSSVIVGIKMILRPALSGDRNYCSPMTYDLQAIQVVPLRLLDMFPLQIEIFRHFASSRFSFLFLFSFLFFLFFNYYHRI